MGGDAEANRRLSHRLCATYIKGIILRNLTELFVVENNHRSCRSPTARNVGVGE